MWLNWDLLVGWLWKFGAKKSTHFNWLNFKTKCFSIRAFGTQLWPFGLGTLDHDGSEISAKRLWIFISRQECSRLSFFFWTTTESLKFWPFDWSALNLNLKALDGPNNLKRWSRNFRIQPDGPRIPLHGSKLRPKGPKRTLKPLLGYSIRWPLSLA